MTASTHCTAPHVLFATPPAALPSIPAGAYIGVTRKTLSNWRSLGVGPAYARLGKSGARIVYRVVDLDRYIEEHMIGDAR
jgi:hypothetical protein